MHDPRHREFHLREKQRMSYVLQCRSQKHRHRDWGGRWGVREGRSELWGPRRPGVTESLKNNWRHDKGNGQEKVILFLMRQYCIRRSCSNRKPKSNEARVSANEYLRKENLFNFYSRNSLPKGPPREREMQSQPLLGQKLNHSFHGHNNVNALD